MAFCADCSAIETQITLERSGATSRYALIETYLTKNAKTRFADVGDWSRNQNLIRLHGDSGSLRVFALLPSGHLQARDGQGKVFAGRARDLLSPVAAASPP